ncbi:FAD-binding protein [Agromyces sp. MMS24-K17]|uniref:FAD-binding protein n=1 Tax=Agromyces sp. MMS24-K17 TaxID=3372850 RepID=UPI0037552C1F
MTDDVGRPDPEALRGLCGGAVHLPGEAGYDAACDPARPGAAALRPAAVLYPGDESEVAEVLRAAARLGFRVLPQRTNLSPPPDRALADVLLIRTAGLGGVAIDPAGFTVRIAAGALWCEVAEAVAAAGLRVALPFDLERGAVGGSVLQGRDGPPAERIVGLRAVRVDGAVIEAGPGHPLVLALRAGVLPAAVVTEITVTPLRSPADASPEREPVADREVVPAPPAAGSHGDLVREARTSIDPDGRFALAPVGIA